MKRAAKKVMKSALKGYPGLYWETTGIKANRFRIVINHDKEIIQEYFHVSNGVTEAKAKRAALKRWRELRVIFPVITKRKFREIPRQTTSSGITGVTRIVTAVKGGQYEFWKASWTTKRGLKQTRQFSINKYGEDQAKQFAIEARNAALDEVGAK